MAERDEQPDSPGCGRSRTGRAVALARLLHRECDRLLQLYVSYLHLHERVPLGHIPLHAPLGLYSR